MVLYSTVQSGFPLMLTAPCPPGGAKFWMVRYSMVTLPWVPVNAKWLMPCPSRIAPGAPVKTDPAAGWIWEKTLLPMVWVPAANQ